MQIRKVRRWRLSGILPSTLPALVVLAVGCEKAPEAPAVEKVAEEAEKKVEQVVAKVQPGAKATVDELAKKAEQLEHVKTSLVALEKDVAAESERWTTNLVASTKKLAATKFDSPGAAIEAALKSEHRAPGNADRDAARHPLETLQFLGLTPQSRVVEMGVGGGWYTEVLAPVVAKNGQLILGTFDPKGADDSMLTVYGRRQAALLDRSPDLFGNAKQFRLGEEKLTIGDSGSADLVLAIREMHNWERFGNTEKYLAAVVDVLEPGGVFGVVQHRAAEGAKASESAQKGYLPEAWVIEKVEAAGLKLASKSEVNANPKDTKDYEKGVWTLPPNYRLGDEDKAKYTAIGESDRMTLRFEKPKG